MTDPEDWLIKPGELEIDLLPSGQPWVLGRGAFGVVHRATLNGFQVVAVKTALRTSSNSAQDDFLKEIAILRHSGSENIVRFIGICNLPDSIQLVTELMEGDDLYHALQEHAFSSCVQDKALSWYRR